MSKILMDVIWELDDGKTFEFYDKTHAEQLEQASIGTKVVWSAFGEDMLKNDDKRPRTAVIAGKARNARQIRVKQKGYKTPNTYWAGFWDIAK